MTDWSPNKVAILGAGAMGCLFGGTLRAGGMNVTLIDTWRDHVEAIQRDGLRLEGFGGDRVIQIPATWDPGSVGPVDLVVIQCKALFTRQAIENAGHLFGSETVTVSFQNGLGNEELIGQLVGDWRVLGGLTAQGATVMAPGVVRNWGDLPTYVGEMAGGLSPRVERLCAAFSAAGLDTRASDHIRREMWKKLLGNVGLSSTSAIANLSSVNLMSVPEMREVALGAVDEAAAVAAAEGIEFDAAEVRSVLDKLVDTRGGGTGSSKSSACVDLLNGRKTEVDWINGSVVRLGKKHGISTPINRTLVAAVKAIEKRMELEQLD